MLCAEGSHARPRIRHNFADCRVSAGDRRSANSGFRIDRHDGEGPRHAKLRPKVIGTVARRSSTAKTPQANTNVFEFIQSPFPFPI